MELVYKPISEFRKEYAVFASFYTKTNEYDCRLFADVVRRDAINADIDAYIVMINPGSCKSSSDCISEFQVVECKSDAAQKCVMSLMATCNLKKVRILNLSDYRSGNSKEAIEKMLSMGLDSSIFSDARKNDFDKVVNNEAPFILAWGLNNQLCEYKKQAYDCLINRVKYGICVDDDNYAYRYIKPFKVADQKQIIGELASCILGE